MIADGQTIEVECCGGFVGQITGNQPAAIYPVKSNIIWQLCTIQAWLIFVLVLEGFNILEEEHQKASMFLY